MKTAFIIFVLITAGCAKTGIGPVDEIHYPRKVCGLNVTLQNSSSKDLTLSTWGTESSDGAGCKSTATDEKAARVRAGESATVELNMECHSCDIHPVAIVYESDKRSPLVYSGSFKYKIVCVDSGCKGEN